MISYNKSEVKEALSIENIFDLLTEWGGDPEYTDFGILSHTICHNAPGEGSKKLYYYTNSQLFKCYTGCDSYFDIFELFIKISSIQHHQEHDLNDAVRWVARRFGIAGEYVKEDENALEDWARLDDYDRIQKIDPSTNVMILKEYDSSILDRFNYNVHITPWLKEGISQESIVHARIGFYPGEDQITIPHFDREGRFIGLRGRTLCKAEGEKYGKYRPMKINDKLYNHPLGMNLYNLNNSQDNIKLMKKAIVFEGEKSCLLYQSYFGIENDISVACCGSNLSAAQMQLLLNAGAEEVIIAFDRQFQEHNDDEFKHLKRNLMRTREKYKNYALISFIFDKHMTLAYKASPIDEGPEKFLTLFKERIILEE